MSISSGDKFFMASVNILTMQKDLQTALAGLETGSPLSAASALRMVIETAAKTLEDIMLKRLSDHTNCPRRVCVNQCEEEAVHCGFSDCTK